MINLKVLLFILKHHQEKTTTEHWIAFLIMQPFGKTSLQSQIMYCIQPSVFSPFVVKSFCNKPPSSQVLLQHVSCQTSPFATSPFVVKSFGNKSLCSQVLLQHVSLQSSPFATCPIVVKSFCTLVHLQQVSLQSSPLATSPFVV